MCFFPNDINYQGPAPVINPAPQLPRGPRSQVTRLLNRGLLTQGEANELYAMSMTQLEADILNRIAAFDGNGLESIFHRIQIWGGSTGRYIYVRAPCAWDQVAPQYLLLLQACLDIQEITHNSLLDLRESIIHFDANVDNIGLSFITKHTRFWLHRSLGENALPIYDSRMAEHVMHQRYVRAVDLVHYWEAMSQKAIDENISLDQLERHLFVYWG